MVVMKMMMMMMMMMVVVVVVVVVVVGVVVMMMTCPGCNMQSVCQGGISSENCKFCQLRNCTSNSKSHPATVF